ncbi:hypothetical protein [Ottowia testudinis]|uniref:Uncharacterized protein n=1 Tax=Ottowia testudinis TaxID=2816950 RepID=A0A975CMV3_9BURK|nr:hypothetical protein [Ottowia testudinis]QTD46408.1 hypothetical protein J1M35_05850 [Ottowia testudinis]
MLYVHYVRTARGREAMAPGVDALTARERQLMLLCSGQRPLPVLIEVFGHSVVRELHELVVRGLVQAQRLTPAVVPPGQAMPLVGSAAARLLQTRDFATVVARSIEGAAGATLAARHGASTQPDDILAYGVALVELLFHAGDVERAKRVGYKLADLLPRQTVPLFIDRMLNGADPKLAAALHEHLLSDRDFPQADAGGVAVSAGF